MSKKSNAVRRLGCRQVRRRLQEQHDRYDREEAAGVGAAVEAAAATAASAVAVHLQGCPACRRFQEFLAGYGRELAASLDALYAAGPTAAASDRDAPEVPGTPEAPDAPERQARRPAARWAVPAAAAALLVIAAGSQVPRLAARARVERRIRREVTALVEAVYSRPLAQGVETVLAGGRMLEDLAEGDGLQGLGEGEDFPAW